jgi:hypothetical protein
MFGDVAKSFGRNFLVAQLLPATLFVIANTILMFSGILPKPEYLAFFKIPKELMFFIIISFLALLLRQYNITVIKLYEGYYKKESAILGLLLIFFSIAFDGKHIDIQEYSLLNVFFLLKNYLMNMNIINFIVFIIGLLMISVPLIQAILKEYHKMVFNMIRKKIEDKKGMRLTRSDLMREHRFSRNYPPYYTSLYPTKLGNIIRAFELHPYILYSIDPITMWPRLLSVVPQNYREQIDEEETKFSSMLNISFVLTIIAIECIAIHIQRPSAKLPVIVIFLSVVSFIVYMQACSYAIYWGEYVRSTFDIYRLDLLKQIGIFLKPETINIENEKHLWNLIQRATFYVENPGNRLQFIPKNWEGKNIIEYSESLVSHIKSISEILSLNEEQLLKAAIKEFLLNKIKKGEKNVQDKYHNLGVDSIDKMKELTEKGEIGEDELQKVENIILNNEKIRKILDKL